MEISEAQKWVNLAIWALLTALPAAFMSAVSATYILTANEGFRLPAKIACPIGLGFAAALLVVYVVLLCRRLCGSCRGSKNA